MMVLSLTGCSGNTPADEGSAVSAASIKDESQLEKELKDQGWKVKNTDQTSLDLWNFETPYNILLAQDKESNLLFVSFFDNDAAAKKAFEALVPSEGVRDGFKVEDETEGDQSPAQSPNGMNYEQAVVVSDTEGVWVFRLYGSELSGYWSQTQQTELANSLLNSLEIGAPAPEKSSTDSNKNEQSDKDDDQDGTSQDEEEGQAADDAAQDEEDSI